MINIRKIDLNLLIAFDVLYDIRNVTRAADRLALTQPTVSGMLARLRDLFCDPLFVRTQHGVIPTPRADALAKPIKTVLTDIKTLVTPAEFDPATAAMTISISANDYIQHALIVPLIKSLRKKAPGIRLAILPADIAGLADKMARGTIDLAVTIPEFSSPDLPSRLLYTERYVCATRKGHPLSGKKLSLDDFCRFDHVIVSPTGGSFEGPVDRALAELVASRRVSVSLPSFHVLLETLRTDDFVALVPARLLYDKIAGLKTFEPPITVPDFDVIATWHHRVDKDPAHRWIRALLTTVAEGLSKGTENAHNWS
jgi:DNA-binding transcriptional LysR family regulator